MKKIIDLIDSNEDVGSWIRDNIDIVSPLLQIQEGKFLIETIEIGVFQKRDFDLTLKIPKEVEELLFKNFYPSILIGKYQTSFKKFSQTSGSFDKSKPILFDINEELSQLDNLGLSKEIDVVLTRQEKNIYKMEPILKISKQEDKSVISDYLREKFLFFFDSETSGLNPKENQMLEFYGKIVKDGETLDEITVSLLPEEKIEKTALTINKIDPYSEEWKRNSVSQDRAANLISEFLEKYSKKGPIVFCAYRAEFDFSFLSALLNKAGLFEKVRFSGIFDPLNLSRHLTESKKLETKIKENGKMCHTLNSVAEALDVTHSGDLHRAKTDVILLEKITSKLISIA